MTKEEWGPLEMYPYDDEETNFDGKPHEVAARALYGQPFGFTVGDVNELRAAAAETRLPGQRVALLAIASRIEALLPPEG